MPRELRALDVTPQPWRNGGGRTRELVASPPGADWMLRVSLADIDVDGPFSAFPGVQRWFAVVAGAGVVLTLPGATGTRRLTTADEPFAFDGAAAPGCRLIDGPTRDLNLMLRGGLRGEMARARSGEPWTGSTWRWRACFTAGAARWQGGDAGVRELAPFTLLGDLGSAPGTLVAHDATLPMFWIRADLDGVGGAP